MSKEELMRLHELVLATGDHEMVRLVEKMILERESLIRLASTEPLTGLLNRHVIPTIKDCVAVVMCDMDGFREVNSIYGHDGGDAALKIVAKIMTSNVKLRDYVIRFGGDEFLIVFTDCNKEVVFKSMERIRKQVEENGIYDITLSIGIAYKEHENEDVDSLKTNADKALYHSKDSGKNQITIYSDMINRKINTSIVKPKTLAIRMS